jgi:hypothetical protein
MHGLLERPTQIATRYRAKFKDAARELASGGMADYMVTHADPNCHHMHRESTEPTVATAEEIDTHGRCAHCG